MVECFEGRERTGIFFVLLPPFFRLLLLLIQVGEPAVFFGKEDEEGEGEVFFGY